MHNKIKEMEKLNTKVGRYIELSQKFQKSAEDIFGKESVNNNCITFNGNQSYSVAQSGTGIYLNSQATETKPKTRAEKIREKGETEAKLAEDYDEYLKLQTELGNYFKALNKIEQ